MDRIHRTDAELRRLLEDEIKRAGSATAWAKANCFSAPFVCDVLAGREAVSPRLAAALGFRRARLWEAVPQ